MLVGRLWLAEPALDELEPLNPVPREIRELELPKELTLALSEPEELDGLDEPAPVPSGMLRLKLVKLEELMAVPRGTFKLELGLDRLEDLAPVPSGTNVKVDPVPTGPRRLDETEDEMMPVPSGAEGLEIVVPVVLSKSVAATALGGRLDGGINSGTPLGTR